MLVLLVARCSEGWHRLCSVHDR